MTRLLRLAPFLVGVSLAIAGCLTEPPSAEEIEQVVLDLRQYRLWAWSIGIVSIWADLVAPVPQTLVLAALGILYGALLGGLIGSVALVTGGLLGYALARAFGRGLAARLAGESSLQRVQRFFDRAGMWAIVLTRSLPYSIPEAVIFVAGLGSMPLSRVVIASCLGSVPTAFAFAAIGAGWDERPLLALGISWVIPIVLLPFVLLLMRDRGGPAPSDPP
jgi:uncharacterized membrane protein YdjX (TVP38/TMEM64 family)